MKLNKFTFNKYLNNNFVFENSPKIAVAVSGGPDSMALIYLINNWVKSKTIRGSVIALVVDHQIRKNSKKETQIINKILNDDKISCKILTINKSKVIKKSMSEARYNRFEAMLKYCKKNQILHLFLGHHKNDNLETFLMRKISGSDIEGLASINSNIIKDNINIIRPLLEFKKKDIYYFNKKNKIQFIEDPSNQNILYTRPILRRYINNLKKDHYKEIENEFNIIKKNILPYNIMISEILIKNIKHIDKKKIIFDLTIFKQLDNLIKEKIIKKI